MFMAKKSKLTPLQMEYQKEIKLLKRRTKQWQKSHRILYTDIPEMPKRVTKQSIEKIKQVRFKNLTEKQIKSAQKAYNIAYDRGELPETRKPKKEYKPPTENDFLNDNDYDYSEDRYEDEFEESYSTDNEPADTIEEIEGYIEQILEGVFDYSGTDRINADVDSILRQLVDNARARMGDREFYEFLSSGDTVSELNRHAVNAVSGSPTGKNPNIPDSNFEIAQFATILNMNRPLSVEQSESLSFEGSINFDYSDIYD
jgi:hypothetical protein